MTLTITEEDVQQAIAEGCEGSQELFLRLSQRFHEFATRHAPMTLVPTCGIEVNIGMGGTLQGTGVNGSPAALKPAPTRMKMLLGE